VHCFVVALSVVCIWQIKYIHTYIHTTAVLTLVNSNALLATLLMLQIWVKVVSEFALCLRSHPVFCHQTFAHIFLATVCSVSDTTYIHIYIIFFCFFDTVGKIKQQCTHYKIYRTRNSTDGHQDMVKYKPLRITDEDMKQFALCQTRATKVCILHDIL